MATVDAVARAMSGVRMVPQRVQLRLDEPSDGELLALLRTERDAIVLLRQTGGPVDGWDVGAVALYQAATDATTNLLRSLPRPLDLAVMDRMRALRAQVRSERTPP